MNIIQLDLKQRDAIPSIDPFQRITPVGDRLVFQNLSREILTVSFEANHAFSYSANEINLPAGQTLNFSLAKEWNFIYTVGTPDRPRARAAVITIVQPIALDPGNGNHARFVFHQPSTGLEISPLQAEAGPRDTVVFENQFKDDVILTFQKASPFQGSSSFQVGPLEKKTLEIAQDWQFPFSVSPVDKGFAPENAVILFKVGSSFGQQRQ